MDNNICSRTECTLHTDGMRHHPKCCNYDNRIYTVSSSSQGIDKRTLEAHYFQEVIDQAQEAVSTTWRFIGAYKKENAVPIDLALKSAEYNLRKIDHIFGDIEKNLKHFSPRTKDKKDRQLEEADMLIDSILQTTFNGNHFGKIIEMMKDYQKRNTI